jgi:hypothetical protein
LNGSQKTPEGAVCLLAADPVELEDFRLGATGAIFLQASLRFFRPKALGLFLAQFLQASQKPLREGRAMMNVPAQGV